MLKLPQPKLFKLSLDKEPIRKHHTWSQTYLNLPGPVHLSRLTTPAAFPLHFSASKVNTCLHILHRVTKEVTSANKGQPWEHLQGLKSSKWTANCHFWLGGSQLIGLEALSSLAAKVTVSPHVPYVFQIWALGANACKLKLFNRTVILKSSTKIVFLQMWP
jgi:hypothetical protein